MPARRWGLPRRSFSMHLRTRGALAAVSHSAIWVGLKISWPERTSLWSQAGTEKQTTESLLKLHIIPQTHIGTDPAQGSVLANRRIDTAGTALAQTDQFSPGLGIDTDVCVSRNNKWEVTHISDDA